MPGGEAGAQTDPSVCSWAGSQLGASSDPLTGFQATLFAQPRLLPEVQNSDHLSERGPVALGSLG